MEEEDEEEYDELDESITRDPDWRKTPRVTKRNSSFSKRSNSSVNSEFSCKCKTGCVTKRCSCKSHNEACSDSCGCIDCMNKTHDSPKKKKNDDDDDKENECSLNVVSSMSANEKDLVPSLGTLNLPSTPMNNSNARRSVCDPGFATPSFPSQFKKKRFYK